MTAELVDRHTEFEHPGGNTWTAIRSRASGWRGLAVPATIITAADDPIVPVADLKRLAASRTLRAVVTPRGGHCGFLTGVLGDTWAENAVVAHLTR